MNTLEVHDVFDGHGVEIALPESDAFLKIRETLTRVGLLEGENRLSQPCFILHKKGRYAIMHSSELRSMDGEPVRTTDEDVAIRNRVAKLLEDWGLAEILDVATEPKAPVHALKIVPHKFKHEYVLAPQYEIGRKR